MVFSTAGNALSRLFRTAVIQPASGCIACALLLIVIAFGPIVEAKNIFDDDWTPAAAKKDEPRTAANPDKGLASNPTAKPNTPPVLIPTALRPQNATAPFKVRPVPSKAEQSPSRKLMAEVYATELADRSPSGRKALAIKLFDAGQKSVDTPADQFVLFMGASSAAREGIDLPLCFKAIDAAAVAFDIDALPLKSAAALSIAGHGGSPESDIQSCQVGITLVEELMARDDYIAASRLTAILRPLAESDQATLQRLQSLARQVELERNEWTAVTKHQEKLKAAPDDPAASLAVGRYFCFIKGDWNRGLPMLAKAADPTIQAVAKAEIAAPSSATDQKIVGDLWWELSTATTAGSSATLYKNRAAYWYRQCEPNLTGLAAMAVKNRLANLEVREKPSTPVVVHPAKSQIIPGLRLEYFEGENFEKKIGERLDSKVASWWGGGAPGPGAPVDHFSVRWSGFIRMPRKGIYQFSIRSDDGSRVFIGGKLVFDHWKEGLDNKAFEVELTTEPQPFVFELRDNTDNSHAGLFLHVGVSNKMVVVPPSCFSVESSGWDDGATATWGDGQGLERTIYGDEKFLKPLARGWDANIDWGFWHASIAEGMPQEHVSIRWRGFLLIPATAEYQFTAYADDILKVWIDGKLLIDDDRHGKEEVTVKLEMGPHPIVTDFINGDGDALASLHWAQVDGFVEHPIPPSNFFTSRDAALRAMKKKK